jgi:hypothetical protein
MAIVRPDLIALYIILFAIFAGFFIAYWVYPALLIGVAALIGGLAAFGYWMYLQMRRG